MKRGKYFSVECVHLFLHHPVPTTGNASLTFIIIFLQDQAHLENNFHAF